MRIMMGMVGGTFAYLALAEAGLLESSPGNGLGMLLVGACIGFLWDRIEEVMP